MNERWRVVLAGLIAVLAIPFLVIDSSSTAEGVVESVADAYVVEILAVEDPVFEVADRSITSTTPVKAAAVVIRPNVVRLANRASQWGLARRQAIEEGRYEPTVLAPPSNTDLALLPQVDVAVDEQAATEVTSTTDTPTTTTSTERPAPETTETTESPDTTETPGDGEDGVGATEADREATASGDADSVQAPAETTPDTSPAPPPRSDAPVESEDQPREPKEPTPAANAIPAPPAQVDGRVPPPAGGPTAAQWDALRRCESTHNYRAVSRSGLYRGAYQFSQATWDWVASIHYPYLVGIDPVDAAPGWQDVMAYTLYAMRGWDQWPICGRHLL